MSTDPIFKSIFGAAWDALPPVMQKHYANRPRSYDVVTVEGIMKVEAAWLAKLLSPLWRISGALVPYTGDNIPVTVRFKSEPESDAYCFDRIFNFPGRKPYHFRSRMVPVGGNEVVEYMPVGLGWHGAYHYENGKVKIVHRGYRFKLFGASIRVPLELFMGKGYAEEIVTGENSFRMMMDIRHALFGRIYAYSGSFTVTEVSYRDR